MSDEYAPLNDEPKRETLAAAPKAPSDLQIGTLAPGGTIKAFRREGGVMYAFVSGVGLVPVSDIP